MNFETSKTLGGIGAILLFIGVLPYVSTYGVLMLVGAIMILVAMKGFADYYREAGIFNNSLYAVITAVVGVVAFAAIAVVALLDFFTELGVTFGVGNISEWSTQISQIDWQNISFNVIGKFAGIVLLDIVVLFVFVLVTALLLRRSLGMLSAKTGVGLFGTTGTLLLIGAVLTIIFGIGLILVWISMLLLAIAFFQMKPPQPQTATPTQNITP